MKTQVLVPLDGSPLAEQALPCAMALGRGLPAGLVLFHAVSIPSDAREILDNAGRDADALIKHMEAKAKAYLDKVAGQLQDAGMSVQQVIRHGAAAEAIVDYAEQAGIQQIVMATHGYTGVSRWTHGSVAERVLQSASVPVLMVCALAGEASARLEPVRCRRILVPLDGSTTAEQVLPPATSIAKALGAEMVLFRVSIVHVSGWYTGEWFEPLEGDLETANHYAKDYLNRVASDLVRQGIKVSTVVQMGTVAESIASYAETQQIDLIAMCTHGRTGLERWILGSVADRVLRVGHVPILLVRAR
jgi:nucleotide-binding universal stress UspA family protein